MLGWGSGGPNPCSTPVDLKPVPSKLPPLMGVVGGALAGGGPFDSGGGGNPAGMNAWAFRCQAPSGALGMNLPGSMGALPKLIVCGPWTVHVTFSPTLASISAGMNSLIDPCGTASDPRPATFLRPGCENWPAFALA